MKVAVVGAGGIGGYVGGRLAEAGETVALVARGPHLEALRRDGLRIECPLGDVSLPGIKATDDPAEIGPVDIVIVTVKLGGTDAAAGALAPLLAAHTRVVSLQNGIDAKAMIARHVDARQVAAGCTYLSAHIRAPGVIHAPGGAHGMTVDGLSGDPAIGGFVQACLRATGLEAKATEDIDRVLWEKFVTLVAFSGATCLTRSPIGTVFAHPEAVGLLRALVVENLSVAAAAGQDFGPDRGDALIAFYRTLHGSTKSSMLVDLEAGRPLEMPWLSGRMLDLARSFGQQAPATAAVVAALAPHVEGRPGPAAPG
ncbi:MAG: 2-dehydropantoate 2-reductase [Amaricoccus sp.]